MVDLPYIAYVAALIGDPTRASMLSALKDESMLSASELAYIAAVAPNTASGHLAKLVHARLVTFKAEGRHRYYQLSQAEVADALEALEVLSVATAPANRLQRPQNHSTRFARSCYDHLAGSLGVEIAWAARIQMRRFLVSGAMAEGPDPTIVRP